MRAWTLAIATLLAVPALARPALRVTVAPSLVKVRPALPLPAEAKAGPVQLTAAKGECEAAHVVISADGSPVRALVAEAAPLARQGGGKLEVSLYREAFLDVKTPSNTEGATGLWPDPLIPTVDPIAHEPRRAFPVDVPARHHQPVLVEVCVPQKAQPGRYEGTLTVRAEGREAARVPVQLDVVDVTIPATSSLPVTFGLSGKSVLMGHYGEKRGDEERLALVRRYAQSALRHRISLHAMTMRQPSISFEGEQLRVDFAAWDKEIAPFLEGLPELDGARFSAIDLRTPPEVKGELLPQYYAQVEAHFREKGWLPRLFAYVMDEPKAEQLAELKTRLEALKKGAPGIRRLVTTPFQESLAGLVDVWTPNINCLEFKQKPREFCAVQTPRELYEARLQKGEQLWWYQSCSSHGCKKGPFGDAKLDAYFTGWPSYMVDVDGGAARSMAWQTFRQRVGGELYFDTVYAYNAWDKSKPERRDPWDSLWDFGGNGDGTLFYPGRPERIGGTTDVPVESLRLKLIRDGLEDYELLLQLAKKGPAGAAQAEQLAQAIAPHTWKSARSAQDFARARTQLLQALAPAAAPSEGPRARPPGR